MFRRRNGQEYHRYTVAVLGLHRTAKVENVEAHFTRHCIDSAPIVRPLMDHGDTKTTTVTFRLQNRAKLVPLIEALRNDNFIDDSGTVYKIGIDDKFQGLTLVARCAGEPQFDFYFVHGLNGHAYNTWNYKSQSYGNDCMWAQDILPSVLETPGNDSSLPIQPGNSEVQNAKQRSSLKGRYFTFGYDARLFSWTGMAQSVEGTAWNLLESLNEGASETLPDKAKYFVCHSLGGLIVCHAMTLLLYPLEDNRSSSRAVPEELKQKFFHSKTGECLVKGIFFFGTPFDGSWLATIMEPIIFTFRCSESFIGNLKPKSKATARTRAAFLKGRMRDGCRIPLRVFYEERKYGQGIFQVTVTSRESALADFKGDVRSCPIPRDHSRIVKYAGKNDGDFFKFVGEKIRDVVFRTIINMDDTLRKVERGLDQNFQLKEKPTQKDEGPILPEYRKIGSREVLLRWWTRVTSESLDFGSGRPLRKSNQRSTTESQLDSLSEFEYKNMQLFNDILGVIMSGPTKDSDQGDPKQDLANQLVDVRSAVDGTCEWILDNPQYKKWQDSASSSLLFVEGQEGVGKSVLAKFLTEHLRRTFKSATVAHFFCRGMNKNNGHTHILRRVIWQLEDQDPGIIRKTLKAQNFTSFNRQPDFDVLWRLFMAMTGEASKPIYCLIDGIDEFISSINVAETVDTENDPVANFLRQLCTFFVNASSADDIENVISTKTPFKTSVLFTTRPLPQIATAGQEYRNQDLVLKINLVDVQSRAKTMIQADIRELVESENLSGDLEGLVGRILSEKMDQAASPFQWGYTALEMLRSYKSQSPGFTIDRLHEFLPQIHDMYFQTLTRISEDKKTSAIASVIFSIMITTREDLDLESICDIFELLPCQHSSKDVQMAIAKCQGIIRISSRGIVEFNHPTVREFLQRLDPINFCDFSCITPEADHYTMAKLCVHYLLLWCDRLVSLDDIALAGGDEYLARARKSPFLSYAIYYWTTHAHESGRVVINLLPSFYHFLRPQGYEWYLMNVYRSILDDEYTGPENFTLLHPASVLASWDLIYILQAAPNYSRRNHFDWRRHLEFMKPYCLRKPNTSSLQFSLDLEAQDSYGYTLLHDAAQNGSLRVMEHLLILESRGDIFDKSGHTPFSRAVSENQGAAALLLINSNQAFECKLESGAISSLHNASLYNLTEVVDHLVTSKMVEVDHPALEIGWTSLQVAAQAGHLEIVQYLIEKGANIESRQTDGKTALLLAAERGHLKIVEELFKREKNLDPAPRTDHGTTPLHAAARNGHPKTFKYLLDKVSYVQPDEDGYLPIHLAAQNGHVSILHQISSNVDIKSLDRWGRQPIHAAAKNGHVDIVRELIQRGADADAAAADQSVTLGKIPVYCITPLYIGIANGHDDLIDYLLSLEVNVQNWKLADNSTYLHRVAYSKKEKLFLVLMEQYHLDPFQPDDNSLTPYFLAVEKCSKSLVEHIWTSQWSRGRSIDDTNILGETALHFSLKDGNIETVKYLLTLKPDLNLQSYLGWSAVMIAAKLKETDLLDLLVNEHADIGLKNKLGQSAVHHAAVEGNLKALEILQDCRAEIDAPDLLGQTPLQLAVERRRTKCCAKLLEWGANGKWRNKFGMSALDYAQGYPAILELPLVQELAKSYSALSSEDRDYILRNSITEHFSSIPSEDRRSKDNPFWTDWLETLGLFFLKMERESDASICYEHQFRKLSDGSTTSSYMCEKCYISPYGAIWQCRNCPEVSICSKCYGEWKEGDLPEGCAREHSYIEMGGEAWAKLQPGMVNADGNSFEEWLAKLQKEFS